MPKKTIEICGKEYPCRMTMGAMRRFRRMAGKEVSDIGGDLSEVGTLMYCCTASACHADGVELPYDEETFCDHLDMEQVAAFTETLEAGNAEAKKKEEDQASAS